MTRLEVEIRLGVGAEKVREFVTQGALTAHGTPHRPRYDPAEVEALRCRLDAQRKEADEVRAMRLALSLMFREWRAGRSAPCPLCDERIEVGGVPAHFAEHRTALDRPPLEVPPTLRSRGRR